MRLDEFKVGDKVHCNGNDFPSEIIFIAELCVLLRNQYGGEFLRGRDSEDFELWRPQPTIDGLQAQIVRLSVLGDDLIAAIEQAIPHHLPSQTVHMYRAVANFREERRRGL